VVPDDRDEFAAVLLDEVAEAIVEGVPVPAVVVRNPNARAISPCAVDRDVIWRSSRARQR
jgi:hypothetical protein